MSIIIQREPLGDCIQEMAPMLVEHWKEVAMYQDEIPLDPDWDFYASVDDLGVLQTFTCRDEGKLIGYFLFFCKSHPHYRNDNYAVNDIVYFHPDYRVAEVVPGAFRRVENILKAEGFSVVTYHMKVHKPWHKLMEGLNYDHAEHLYSKLLK